MLLQFSLRLSEFCGDITAGGLQILLLPLELAEFCLTSCQRGLERKLFVFTERTHTGIELF